MIYYIVNKKTGEFIGSTISLNYQCKADETIVNTEWINGLYKPKYDFQNSTWIESITENEIDLIKEENDLYNELCELKMWFNLTDYIVLKVMRGNWLQDDPRYIEYLQQYKINHKRKEEIERQLGIEEEERRENGQII